MVGYNDDNCTPPKLIPIGTCTNGDDIISCGHTVDNGDVVSVVMITTGDLVRKFIRFDLPNSVLNSVAVDRSGNIYCAGYRAAGANVFANLIIKLDPNLTVLKTTVISCQEANFFNSVKVLDDGQVECRSQSRDARTHEIINVLEVLDSQLNHLASYLLDKHGNRMM